MVNKKYFMFVFVLIIVVSFSEGVLGATINAASCERVDVQAAIDSAVDGDTVLVPAGECIWNITITIAKSIIFKGAGIGNTIITCTGGTGISYIIAGDVAFEMSGFTLKDDDKANYGLFIYNSLSEPIYNLKVHHNRFEGWAFGIKPHGMIYGVIYENEFHNNNYDLKPLGVPSDKEAWILFPGATNIGTRNYLYIENCTSTGVGTFIMSSGEGARWVYRYNTVDITNRSGLFDAHGDTLNYGVVAHELYENTLTTDGPGRKFHDFRGGTGIVFNNDIERWAWIAMREEYVNGACIDPNFPESLSINNAYLWNNVDTTNSNALQIISDTCIPCGGLTDIYECIAENSEWWDDAPETTSDTDDGNDFTKDLAANRPTTCIDDDVYWETDTRKLYRCDGVNNWTFIYEPYTYPHPLTIETTLTCTDAGGTCQTNTCATYADCSSLVGDCVTGYCCSGTCTASSYFLPEQFIEAENGNLILPMQTGTNTTASGGQYVYISTGYNGSVRFTFDILEAGNYKMEARILTPPVEGAHNSFYVGVDGELAQGEDAFVFDTIESTTFTWDDVSLRGLNGNFSYSEYDPMVWDLSAGLHTFTFYGRESNTWLDQIILKKVSTTCSPADTDTDGVVSILEVMAYITEWKAGSVDIVSLMNGITEWKSGCT